MDEPASDQAAWLDRAVTRYQSLLQRYALRLVGDAQRAQDVVQDTFLKLVRENRSELNGRLAEWLYTVCRNRALDVRRKESRMVALADEAEVAATAHSSESADAQTKETFGTALAALAKLPERQQEVVRLKFEHELSYQQIAEVTGLSVSNVGYLLHTALKALRQRLADS
jgi:RNA polymerase sigma factor (sigma-70 family)